MTFLEFPTRLDWEKHSQQIPFDEFDVLIKQLEQIVCLNTHCCKINDKLINQLKIRLSDALKSAVMLGYYFDKGIPDDLWCKTPEADDCPLRYFPDFEEEHFVIKNWFDFYADIFFARMDASWSILAQIFNEYYQLGLLMNQLDFPSVVKKMKIFDKKMSTTLMEYVIQTETYRTLVNYLQNDLCDYSPSSAGLSTNLKHKATCNLAKREVSVRRYIPAKEMMKTTIDTQQLFLKTLRMISKN